MGPLLEVGIVLLLFIANGVFSASELALVSARRNRLETLAERGNKRAKLALELAASPSTLLATVQVGITLVGTVAAAFGGSSLVPYVEPWLHPLLGPAAHAVAFTLVVAAITFVSLVIGELVPKRLALRSPERLAMAVAPLMAFLARVARGLIWVLTGTTNLILRLLGAHAETVEAVTEEDVRAMVVEAAETGGIEPSEGRMIDRVLSLTDRRARDLMTARRDVAYMDVRKPLKDLVGDVVEGGHTRYPAHAGDTDEPLGFLYARDLLRLGLNPGLDVRELVRPAVFVPENAYSEDVLKTFQRHGQRIALVVDEYGAVIGLVTANDIISELVGELAEGVPTSQVIVRREDGTILVEGDAPLHEVRDELGIPEGGEDAATLAGYLLHHLGRIPAVGEAVEVDGWRFEVMDMDGSRIDEVLVIPPG